MVLQSRLTQLHAVLELLNSPAEKLLLALDKKDVIEFEYGVSNMFFITHVMSCDL